MNLVRRRTRVGVWAPDGRGIIFSSARAGQLEDIYEKQMGRGGETLRH